MIGDNGIITLDLHGCRVDEAEEKINKALKQATSATYRIRLIHGFNRGTQLRKMIYREFGYGLEPKVLRIVEGANEGITELVLREY